MIAMRTDGLTSTHLDGGLYGADRVSRDLVVVIDVDTVEPDPANVDVEGLLGGVLLEDSVQSLRYSDDGAPAEAPLFGGDWEPDHPVGWVVVSDDESDMMTRGVSVAYGSTLRQAALFTQMASVGAQLLPNAVPHPEQAARDALMVAAVESLGADILITRRDAVLTGDTRFARGVTVVTPGEALPLIGLYLRARGVFIRSRGARVAFSSTKAGFYEAAVRRFAPRFVAVVHHLLAVEAADFRAGVASNGVSALRRARRSFERRDRLWILSNQAHDAGVAEDALAEFEVLLTSLVGVLDPFARIADEVLQLGTTKRQLVGWQKHDWRKAVKKANSALGDVFSDGTAAGDVLIVLTRLRNLIHAEGLNLASFGDGRQNQHTWFTIPPETVAGIIETTGRANFAAEWGFKVTSDGYWLADPGPLAVASINVVYRIG